MGAKSERGQAAVELLGALPLIVIVLLLGQQLVVSGHSVWKLHEAARIAARAEHVAEQRGAPAEGRRHAEAVLARLLASSPAASRKVSRDAEGVVRVRVRIPLVEPFRSALGPMRAPLITASSRMQP